MQTGQRKGRHCSLLPRLPSPGRVTWSKGSSLGHWSSTLESTSWPQSFHILFYNITIIYFLSYSRDKNSHFKHQKWSGVKELLWHLSLSELRSRSSPCSLIQCWLRAYVPGTRLGSGRRRWVGPNPVCQGICSLVRNTPCLLSYPTLMAGLEGRGARSSVSHSLKNWNGKTWDVITRKSSWRTKG